MKSRREAGVAESPKQYLGPAWASIKHNPDGSARPDGPGGPGGRADAGDFGRGYRPNEGRPAPYSPPRYDGGRTRAPVPRNEYARGGADRERDFYRERDERDCRRDGGRAPPPRDARPPATDRYDERRGEFVLVHGGGEDPGKQ